MSTRPGLLISSSLFFILPTNVAGFPSRRRCFLPFPDTPLLSGCLLSGMLCCCIFNGGICNWIVIEFSWKRICQLYIYIESYFTSTKLMKFIEKRWLEDWASSLNFIWDSRLDKRHRISSIVSVSTEDRFSKRFNRRFSLFLAPISRFSIPLPSRRG